MGSLGWISTYTDVCHVFVYLWRSIKRRTVKQTHCGLIRSKLSDLTNCCRNTFLHKVGHKLENCLRITCIAQKYLSNTNMLANVLAIVKREFKLNPFSVTSTGMRGSPRKPARRPLRQLREGDRSLHKGMPVRVPVRGGVQATATARGTGRARHGSAAATAEGNRCQ